MVALIRGGVPADRGIWADLGAGSGNFTWALAELLGAGSTIYAIDRDGKAIAAQRARLAQEPPAAIILPVQADFVQPLKLPLLDGVLMANALHFVRDPAAVLQRIRGSFKPGGRLLVVEYEVESVLRYVPFPLPFARFSALALATGFHNPDLVGTRRSPSSGMVMYAAVASAAAVS